jgi:hypothetical protein
LLDANESDCMFVFLFAFMYACTCECYFLCVRIHECVHFCMMTHVRTYACQGQVIIYATCHPFSLTSTPSKTVYNFVCLCGKHAELLESGEKL